MSTHSGPPRSSPPMMSLPPNAARSMELAQPAMYAAQPPEARHEVLCTPEQHEVGRVYPDSLAPRVMHQLAPWPADLADLVSSLRYRQHLGWSVRLEGDYVRDPADTHKGEARGLTLIVTRSGPNTYRPDETMRVAHMFAVPAATYNRESWRRWLFDRLGDVDTHERMEDFAFAGDTPGDFTTRPYAPNHGPGWDPYLVTAVVATDADRRTSFRGTLNQ